MSKSTQPITILKRQTPEQAQRFASFESWREALEKEWGMEETEIKEMTAKLDKIESDYVDLMNHKLQFYIQIFQEDNLAVDIDDLFYIQEKHSKNEFTIFEFEANKIDANLQKQNDPDLQDSIKEFQQRHNALRQQSLALAEQHKAKGQPKERSVKRSLQLYYTSQFIDALEQNDQETLKSLEGKPHLHPDITSKNYLNLLERTERPAPKHPSVSSKSVTIIEQNNTEATFKRSDSPTTFMNNHVLGWQNASKRIIAAAQNPTAEGDRNSPTRGILKNSPARIAEREAARIAEEQANLQAERLERARQHATNSASVWARFRANTQENGGMKL